MHILITVSGGREKGDGGRVFKTNVAQYTRL